MSYPIDAHVPTGPVYLVTLPTVPAASFDGTSATLQADGRRVRVLVVCTFDTPTYGAACYVVARQAGAAVTLTALSPENPARVLTREEYGDALTAQLFFQGTPATLIATMTPVMAQPTGS